MSIPEICIRKKIQLHFAQVMHMFYHSKINRKNSSDKGSFCCGTRTLLDVSMIFHFDEMFLKVNF